MKTNILFLTIIGMLCACSSDDENQTQTIDMRIDHYQNTGFGLEPILTLRVQENENIGSDNWIKFYSYIAGFDYQPGFIYDIKVIAEQIDNPPADGSSLKYTLQEIKAAQEVSDETTFKIDLKTNGQSFITTTSGYEILDQIEIDCNTLCGELDTRLLNQDFVIGTFKRLQSNVLLLIATE